MNNRLKKQIIIGVIFFVLLVLVGVGIFFLIKPAPTCYDGKQNQGETGIDCGGPCSPCVTTQNLQASDVKFFVISPQSVDVMARITNPNYELGTENAPYTFTLYDANHQVVAQRSGQAVIFPGSSRYIIEPAISISRAPASVDVSFGAIQWQSGAQALQTLSNIQLLNQDPKITTDALGNLVLNSNILNQSSYGFGLIEVDAVGYDAQNNIVGVGKTYIRTVQAGERRIFSMQWPRIALAQIPVRFDVVAITDIFNLQNFLGQSPTISNH